MRTRLRAVALCASAAVLAGCASSASEMPRRFATYGRGGPPSVGTSVDMPVPARVANLPLVDENGRRVTLASYRGKTVVLADFLTLCQEICPLTSVNLQEVDDAVQRAGLASKVVILEVTVDPKRDTPARLAAYQKLFGASPDWVFATGTTANLKALWGFFGVGFTRVPEDQSPAPRDWLTGKRLTYDVDHQDVLWIVNPQGHAVWEEAGNPDTHGTLPPSRLKAFLSAEGHHNVNAPGAASWSAGDVEKVLSKITGTTVS